MKDRQLQAENLNSKTPHSSSHSPVMSFCNSKAFPCCGDNVGTIDLQLQTPGATGSQLELAALANASGTVFIAALRRQSWAV